MSTSNAPRAFSRRTFLTAAATGAAASLAGCVTVPSTPSPPRPAHFSQPPRISGHEREMYSAMVDDGYEIPAVPIERIDPRYYRQEVADPTGERPGTIVVDTAQHFLYLVRENGRALRYGVGLGRAGFEWSGRAEIARKATWPRWYPPAAMIDRQPELEEFRPEYDSAAGVWRGGMDPGLRNPLGARALYIYENGKDTLYRVHGSPEWWTIGRSVSSGCVRMINQDVIDLYDRVPVGSEILVTHGLFTA